MMPLLQEMVAHTQEEQPKAGNFAWNRVLVDEPRNEV